MNLIEQFMKMGGFKTPQELEAYGEERFFNDFPAAKKLAKGGTPEAFPQIATADKFFSYGVPVPPTYYEQGGATGLPNIYPQIQSAGQFFSPVYTNSNNAYKAGGSYEEAFPQAVSYPQAGWGKTNYFMLSEGGAFPPGMPQYTGMLPVMAAGAGLSGIDTRTQEDMNHYYSAYPMMNGGQPSLQEGGQGAENADQSFYVNKMQNFISKLQQNGQKALMKSIETVDEMPPMTGMRNGGVPKFQMAGAFPWSMDQYRPKAPLTTPGEGFDVQERSDGSIVVYDDTTGTSNTYPTREAYDTALAQTVIYNPSYRAEGYRTTVNDDFIQSAEQAKAEEKKARGTSGGVSTSVVKGSKQATAPKARTQSELDAEIKAEKEKAETAGTTGSTAAATTETTTAQGTGQTTATGWEGWKMVTLPDGRRVPVDNTGRVYFDNMYQSGPQYPYYTNQQQANYGNFLDYIPGGGLRRKSANLLLATALAGNDLSQYEIDPRSIVTRRAILPGNRIKSFDLVKKGTVSKPTAVAPIKLPNSPNNPILSREVIDAMNKGAIAESEPIGPITSRPGMLATQQPTMAPYAGTGVNTNVDFDPNDPKHREIMLKSIMEGMKYGGPYVLPMFQSDVFSGENPFGGVDINIAPNTLQDIYWNTGQTDSLNEVARQIEKDAGMMKTTDYSQYDDRLKQEFKRQGPFANLSADQMIAGMDTLAGIFNKYGNWNQENMDFNTALQVYGKSNARNSRGAYLTNQPAVGLGFRPDQANANMRGMYAQYGGQGFYTGDNYYLTMPTIKNVKKAGAFKPGK